MLSQNERGKVPTGTVVRLKKTGEFAVIIGHNRMQQRLDTFLNYYVEIEGRPGTWAAYDDDFELECLSIDPPETQN